MGEKDLEKAQKELDDAKAVASLSPPLYARDAKAICRGLLNAYDAVGLPGNM